MGWYFQHRERGESNIDWFRREFCPDEPEKLIDVATKNGVAYCAFRADRVFALVVLTQWRRGDYHNYGYKDMDEAMGPNEDDCPRRIFDLLDPLPVDRADPVVDGNWAAQWRARVEAKLASQAERPKVKPGARIRFPASLWRGGDYGICTYVGGKKRTNLFRTEHGQLVRFTGWRNKPYEVVA